MPPIVLVCSANRVEVDQLARKISDNEDAPGDTASCVYDWKVNTKYYDALVNVITVHSVAEVVEMKRRRGDIVQAAVFLINPAQKYCADLLDEAIKVLENEVEFDEVIIAVSRCVESSFFCEEKIRSICTQKGYEFVDMSVDCANDDAFDQDGIIKEEYGLDRISSVLKIVPWINMHICDDKVNTIREQKRFSDELKAAKLKKDQDELAARKKEAENITYDELLSKISSYRTKVESMPRDQRNEFVGNIMSSLTNIVDDSD